MTIVVKMTSTKVHLQLHDYFGQESQHAIIIEITFWHSDCIPSLFINMK
jgi:hypothetical protein